MSSSRPEVKSKSQIKLTNDEVHKWMTCDVHYLEPLQQEEQGIPNSKPSERSTNSTFSMTFGREADVADVSTNFQMSSKGTDVESCVTPSSTCSQPQPPESMPMDTSPPKSIGSTTSSINYESVNPVEPLVTTVEHPATIVEDPLSALVEESVDDAVEDPVDSFVEAPVEAHVEYPVDALVEDSVDVRVEDLVDVHVQPPVEDPLEAADPIGARVEDIDDAPVLEPVVAAMEIPVVETMQTPDTNAVEIPVNAVEAPITDPVAAPIAALVTTPVVAVAAAAAAPKPKPAKQNGTGSPKHAAKGGATGKVATTGVVSKKPSAPANATTTTPVKGAPAAASGSPARPSSRRASAPQTPTTPVDDANKKVPMNKVKVGAGPAPNIKEVRSKIGSFASVTHKPKGGNVKIPEQKLTWKAESKVGSLTNVNYVPKGGKVTVDVKKQEPKKVETKDATSKVGSLQNVKHKPGGGEKKIFNDKEYLKKTQSNSSSEHGGSTPHTPRPSSCAANGTPALDVETNATLNNVTPPAGDQNLIDV